MLIATESMSLSIHKKDCIAAVASVKLSTVHLRRFCGWGGYKSQRGGKI
jgi:hypothetical protein